jgi:hypothetical protein
LQELIMQPSTTTSASTDFVVTHPLDPEDAPIVAEMRALASSTKGMRRALFHAGSISSYQTRAGGDAIGPLIGNNL